MMKSIVLAILLVTTDAWALTTEECVALLKRIDYDASHPGDYSAHFFIEAKQQGKNDLFYEGMAYRRDQTASLILLFLAPKDQRGNGYLRLEKNLWLYDPRIGRWERRTERERIGGTSSLRADYDRFRLAGEYDPSYEGSAKLGERVTHVLLLRQKKGVDVAYPKLRIWVDADSKQVIKEQGFGASGKLLRTVLRPKYRKSYSPSKRAEVWVPSQIFVFDELEKGTRTTVLIRHIDLKPLPENMFTKAWLESKSR